MSTVHSSTFYGFHSHSFHIICLRVLLYIILLVYSIEQSTFFFISALFPQRTYVCLLWCRSRYKMVPISVRERATRVRRTTLFRVTMARRITRERLQTGRPS
ncbi:hypothetical protein CC86DRAFT_43066 [Ophiobolus disseminans]|uniref:Uncharacterized protein n=1 Tax=Ophiobolus disseminans TaxID=1469910 RepID=A0A6A6ZX25_9PLEO|nr:hypothetical protein CC86DRAFT_43066 [Ophiobolus disseminans]